MAIVYVLSNPAFDDYVKVGKTTNLEQRLRNLDNTSVPLPFRCVFAIEVEDETRVESLVHQAFADHRTRKSREFFKVDPQRVIAALKLTGGRDVTPRDDIAADEEGLRSLQETGRRRAVYKFSDADVPTGAEIAYANNQDIKATVINEKKILFEGQETSLSRSALVLLHREGYSWQSVNGWAYWMYDGETFSERLHRNLEEFSRAEADD